MSFYHDDPVDESGPRNSIFSSALALVLLLAGGIFFLQSTLAANISLNSGGTIEFGQAVSQAVACSGSQNVTVTPKSSFVNAANGTGSYYLGSIVVTNIPDSCYGADFKLSAFGTSSSTPLAIFNSTSTEAVVYDNAGTFQLGVGSTGTTLTPGTGTFTVSFTSPVALSASVAKVTIQSGVHSPLCSEGGACSVGETGPGGGIVFYRDVNGFTCGATLSASCKYLESALGNWSGGSDPTRTWAIENVWHTVLIGSNAQGSAIGTGYRNSLAIQLQGNDLTTGAPTALAFRGGGKSDWYLPSSGELDQMYLNKALIGGFNTADGYQSSTEANASNAYREIFDSGFKATNNKRFNYYVRPIRAF